MIRKWLAILCGLVLVLTFSSVVYAAGCVDASVNSDFGSDYPNKDVTLCQKTYVGQVKIHDGENFNLDCDKSILSGGLAVTNTSKLSLKNCNFVSLAVSNSFYITVDSASFTGKMQFSTVIFGSVRSSTFEKGGAELFNSSNVEFSGNKFSSCPIGLSLLKSNANTITSKNTFEGNTIGLQLSESTGNKIYGNVFVKPASGTCAKVLDKALVPNSWDNGIDGNYWSDYLGVDANNDGIGDTPYVITAQTNVDNKPFMRQDLSKGAVGVAKVLGEVTTRAGSFTFGVGDAVRFKCGKPVDNKSYEVVLVGVDPNVVVRVGKDEFILKSFASNVFDLDNNGASEVNFAVKGHAKTSAVIDVIRLDPCFFYCGDGKCTAGETKSSCSVDCIDIGTVDGDNDKWTIAMGDCDDTNPKIYPDAKEMCSETVDYDCDGLKGEADTDCQGMGFFFWFLIIVAVLAGGGAIALWFWYNAKPKDVDEFFEETFTPQEGEEAKEEIKAEKEEQNDLNVQRIIDYAENYIEKGYSKAEIREMLATQGWEASEIEKAMSKLKV